MPCPFLRSRLRKVVSPGSPNYLYEGCMRTDDISFRESKPYVGVMKDSTGYLLCQVTNNRFPIINHYCQSTVCIFSESPLADHRTSISSILNREIVYDQSPNINHRSSVIHRQSSVANSNSNRQTVHHRLTHQSSLVDHRSAFLANRHSPTIVH